MADKFIRFGPVAMILTTPTNILNCNITSLAGPVGLTLTQPHMGIRHIRIVNKTAGAVTFSLYLGATGASAAGTEVIGTGLSIPANSAFDWYGYLNMEVADFLVGGAGTTTALTIEGEGTISLI